MLRGSVGVAGGDVVRAAQAEAISIGRNASPTETVRTRMMLIPRKSFARYNDRDGCPLCGRENQRSFERLHDPSVLEHATPQNTFNDPN
jgi:hypothetical protein